jgi:hypothetical protein
MATKTMTAEDQVAEARWWLAEVRNDIPPGRTTRLVERTAAWLADLEARHARCELQPVEIEYDPDIPF